ncbi:MAG: ATP-dependent endonuclease [Actinomycetota bacterium]|nr:ATP-dependent endonuclease [Actinomycetota bacterium]
MLSRAQDEASVTVLLVEGHSDRLAVEALAARLGHDLTAAQVTIVSMDGVTNLHRHLGRLAALPERHRVIGLFDAPELAHVQRAVEELGIGSGGTREELVALGFFACEPDLEGELIRALGSTRMEELLAEHGELARFRRFQNQPEWRERSTDAQLRRFLGTHSGRKARFAPIMIDALEESRIPVALRALLTAAGGP